MKIIVLLGGPGAGKGTLASGLIQNYQMQHFSTGDLLREAVAEQTAAGIKAKSFMDAGNLVPDEVIVGIMKDKINSLDSNSQGVLLDGFPRTINQAEALDVMLADINQKVDLSLLLNCPSDIVVNRICNRRNCSKCGYIGNLNWIDKDQWDSYKCPECGGDMVQRADDTEETVLNRLDVYTKQTAPLIEYYKQKGVFKELDASKNAQTTFDAAKQYL